MDTNTKNAEIVAGYASRLANGETLSEEDVKACAAAHRALLGAEELVDDARDDEVFARTFGSR